MSRPHAQHIPMLARGQMEVASGPGTSRAIPAGNPGDVLTVGPDRMPVFAGAPGGISFNASGELVYGTGPGTSDFLSIGSAGQHLVSNGVEPEWQTVTAATQEINPTEDVETATNLTFSGLPVLMRRLSGSTGGVATVQTILPSFTLDGPVDMKVRFVDAGGNFYYTTSEVGVYRFRVTTGGQIEINVSEAGINSTFDVLIYYIDTS